MSATRWNRNGALQSRKRSRNAGVSSIITTIFITAVLLIILVVASYVATNILSAEMTSTEFEQAKSNMLLLDNTIQDVALRPGAGGYVQFNEREGGIGAYQTTDTLSLTVEGQSKSITYTNLAQLVYTGGPSASAAVDPGTYTSLDGDLGYAYVTSTQTMAFLRLEQDNGAKIKLDFARFRIIPMGLIDPQTNLVQIVIIKLVYGNFSGSGNVRVQVQNAAVNTPTPWQFGTGTLTFTTQHTTPKTTITNTTVVNVPEASKTTVIFSEIQIRVSIS